MQKNHLLLILFLFPFILFAQKGIIRGTVYEQDGITLAIGASVNLIPAAAQGAQKGQQTSNAGTFRFEDLTAGTYRIQISFLGHETYNRGSISITAKQDFNLGKITLLEDGKQIEEVVVQGRVPDLQIGIDKKVFDVSQSTISIGGSAQELL